MDIDEFRHAVALGLGRAVLHVDGPLPDRFAEVVLDACLYNRARDPQVEGSRSQYMLDIVWRTGDSSFYVANVLDALAADAGTQHALHRIAIAGTLAMDSDADARRAMVEAFDAHLGTASETPFAEAFIDLDGMSGLLFAMDRIGCGLVADDERWKHDYLISAAEFDLGKEAVWTAVRERARTNDNVAGYLDAIEANMANSRGHEPEDFSGLSYEELRVSADPGKVASGLTGWGMRAAAVELECAASDLMRETDPRRIQLCLRIFWRRAFPLDPDCLIRFVKNMDHPLPNMALAALAQVENDKVRQYALDLAEGDEWDRGWAIDMLVNNFRPGDHELVKTWSLEERDSEALHSIGVSLDKFFKSHPNEEVEHGLLLALFDRRPCSHCRCSVVERLIELDSLPDELRAEAAWDSYSDTRELVSSKRVYVDGQG